MITIATAGWSIPRVCAGSFPGTGTHLQRYAQVFHGAEINTSFYREHGSETYANWARQTPRRFAFAVKLPRLITHDQQLRAARRPLASFLQSLGGLGRRLGPLIVQLPPSLVFEARVARGFFGLLRTLHDGPVVCEPRHPTWFTANAEALLVKHQVARVAADPAVVEEAARPGGDSRLVYYRLHGSPRKYWSVYGDARVAQWAMQLKALPRGTAAWCVFDNTASGGAAPDALRLRQLLGYSREALRMMVDGRQSGSAA